MSWVLDDDQEVVLICGDTRTKNKARRRDGPVQPGGAGEPEHQVSELGLLLDLSLGVWFWFWRFCSPGAIMISFFLERTRRKVRSFWGSMSRMVVLAFISSWWISPAYWTVLVLSRVVLMGIPEGDQQAAP